MQNDVNEFDPDLADLPRREWLKRLAETSDKNGFFKPLGRRHFAAHVKGGSTLLVSFETIQGMRSLSESSEPLGWSMVRSSGWSHLLVASDGDTWFRDRNIFGLFDRLIDEGFFDAFDTVLFYGAGPCGYAAAAYSVSAPGAIVLAVQPQATLDPRVTEWDERFYEMRSKDFTSRYGYAPDMLDACAEAFVVYDPREQLDAMHAALFTRPAVTKLRMRHFGDALQSDLLYMDMLKDMLAQAATGALDETSFAKAYRARRGHMGYMRRLLVATEARETNGMTYILTKHVTQRFKAPKFKRRRAEIEQQRAAQGQAEAASAL